MHPQHKELLQLIEQASGTPTKHTFLDNYLGNANPRYSINMPTLRSIARAWMKECRDLSASQLAALLTSLVQGKSSTEKMMVGVLLDCSTLAQRKFKPQLFDKWLNHLTGWAEVDGACTGKYSRTEIPAQWKEWSKLLVKFSKSKNINKRRASIVFLCAPSRYAADPQLAALAFKNIDMLKHEKDVLITKAISWVLRSMIKQYKAKVAAYVEKNKSSLPAIAVRETFVKLKTGRKTAPK